MKKLGIFILIIFLFFTLSAFEKKSFLRDTCIEAEWTLSKIKLKDKFVYNLEGEIRNIYDLPIEHIKVVVLYLGEREKVLDKEIISVSPSLLLPNSKANFSEVLKSKFSLSAKTISINITYDIKIKKKFH